MREKPLILFDCERIKHPNTGLNEYCRALSAAMINNHKSEDYNFDLSLYVPWKNDFSQQQNVKRFHQNIFHKIILPKYPQVKLYHCSNQGSNYYPPKMYGWKTVLTIHDFNFLVEKESSEKQDQYLNKIKAKVDQADAVVFISDYIKNLAEELLGTSDKYHRIYNGRFLTDNITVTPPPQHPQKEFLFSLGTIQAKKNFHVLAPILKDNTYDLIIAGQRNEKYVAKIMTYSAKFGVENRIKIVGEISEAEKHWYYQNCKAFCFPSIAEGFGLPVIEAMSYGKPCFISKETALPEVGGDVAYYFDNFSPNSMQQAFETGIKHFEKHNPQKAIKTWASQFSWDKAANSYLALYKSLLNS